MKIIKTNLNNKTPMHLMYVDETGDSGQSKYSSPHFGLSGIIVSEANWGQCLERLKTFRKSIKEKYGLNQRTEIHSTELIRINKLKEYKNIKKRDRINILKDYCDQIPAIFDSSVVINVFLKKEDHSGSDIFNLAWGRLLQRYDTYLKKTANDKGIVIADDTESRKLVALQRKMRVYNPVPSIFSGSRNIPINNILEDTFFRSSQDSYFLQSVDVICHLLYRKEYPKGSLRKYGLEHQFDKLNPILFKKASKNDPHGIVRK
ncbi:MAG: DUF3800 domain-containing protein [Cryomorphaceae bacterium]|nr:DUF3800 domain-containing protein [Cryomorphaceae bacterium]